MRVTALSSSKARAKWAKPRSWLAASNMRRQQQMRAVCTDLQKFNADTFQSVSHLYLRLAESIADQLDLTASPLESWDPRRGPNANFERFIRREILGAIGAPLVWGLDEVDRLFVTPYGTEFFGLLRSWHNERALDPTGPWAGLTIVIAYATEAHLFITDLNQSPFKRRHPLVDRGLYPLPSQRPQTAATAAPSITKTNSTSSTV